MEIFGKIDWADFTVAVLSIVMVVGGAAFLFSLKERVFSYYDRKQYKLLVPDNKKYLRPLFILGVLMVVVGLLLSFLLYLKEYWLVVTAMIFATILVGAVTVWWK